MLTLLRTSFLLFTLTLFASAASEENITRQVDAAPGGKLIVDIDFGNISVTAGARKDVFSLVLRQGVALVAVGIALGLIGAIAASRALSSVLYGVGSLDLGAFLVAIASLAFVALLACFVPARRATLVDPIEALRTE